MVPFKLAVVDKTYVSRVDFDNDGFYAIMEEYEGIPSTSQVTPYEFLELYREHYKNGYTDVINVSINSKGSSTYANACLATEEFFEAHPEAAGSFRIHNIDGAAYAGCYGYAVVEAGKMARSGKSAAEIVNFIRDWCADATAYFVPYSLKYAAKSGRIPSLAAFVGNALGRYKAGDASARPRDSDGRQGEQRKAGDT